MAQAALSDGFVKLCIGDSLNFLEGRCRVLIEGQMLDTGAAEADAIIRVASDRNLATLFGAGSVLAEGLRVALCACPEGVELYALPREDNAAGVAAVYTLTFTGNATSPGRATFYLGEAAYNVDFAVMQGDTPTQIAALFVAEVPSNFPFEATAAAGVVTLTAKNAGTVGNHLNIVYNWAGRSNYAPAGVSVALAQTVQGSVDPVAPNDYSSIIGECCYSCYALLSENIAWQNAFRDHIRDAWDCSKPQCFGHGYTYSIGSLGQILATGDNSPELGRMANSVNTAILPYLKVANYAALSCCIGCENPEVSIQGQTYGLLSCVAQPATCQAEFSNDDIIALRENGFVVTGPATVGGGTLTNPYIYNDVTNYLVDDLGRDNVTFRNTNSRRLATATAISIAEKLQEFNGLGLFAGNTAIREGRKATTPNLMLADIRTWARDNEGVLFSEFDDINRDITLQTDAEVQAKRCTGRPGRLHLNMSYRPPDRIDEVVTNLQPRVLENCDR